MDTGDANYIKKLNRKILIEEIIRNKSLSRSTLARITGLNKATVSVQISDLLHENIVIEKSEGELVTRGRKPILLEINGDAGYSIGIDIDADNINIIFTTLMGKPFHKMVLKDYQLGQITNQLIDAISPIINKFNRLYQPIGLVGVGVSIHGIVNNKNDIIFTPNQQWSNINITEKLIEAFQTTVFVDNNANFSVFAEQVYENYLSDLFCITLHSGIGLGIISENKFYRGYQGFAGEIGHMIIESDGGICACGNKGCWELYASEKVLSKKLLERFPTLSLPDGIKDLSQDEDYLAILDDYLNYLAIGLNNVINIFNPEKIILSGSIINGNSPYISKIQDKLTSKINNYREISASKLGPDASALGGAASALKNFFGVTMINFNDYNYLDSDILKT
ncbi:ROK family transcriptional regulator [Paraliobacillus sediminis]|uniref:ROK family transcriptional regulator n=1 Tax=Paraliobacillus sediminis TaxID=1885916 RepID=UPI0013C2C87B|nr:ROK family transcriptional regulator [Paraliobacillus sediminis]